MGQILHGSATTSRWKRASPTRRTPSELRYSVSYASLKDLSERYGLNSRTVAKWKKRTFVEDAPMGPKSPRSTVLSVEEEAIAVAVRKHTLLPLDDCLYTLQATIPHLTRSSLHRCHQRRRARGARNRATHKPAVRRVDGDKPARKAFKKYPIGYFHVDIAEVRTGEGKLYLFVAIDRTSKFVFVRLCRKAGKMEAAQFLRRLIEAVPYRIHTVLTDNGIQFTNRKQDRYAFEHIFVRTCRENIIEHRLTKISHPWTNGQVGRMNRTLKEATVKRYHYDCQDQLQEHLSAFVDAYNFAKRLKTLRGLTPYEYICKCWTENPDQFRLNPFHHTPGPHTPPVSQCCP